MTTSDNAALAARLRETINEHDCRWEHGATPEALANSWEAVRAASVAVADALAAMTPKDGGTWPLHDLRRAFVAGAKWWEFASTGATMWPADQDKAAVEAERRYPGGAPPQPSQSVAEAREVVGHGCDAAVRPAVACVAWNPDDHMAGHVTAAVCVMEGTPGHSGHWPVTAIDGTTKQIAVRVRKALDHISVLYHDTPGQIRPAAMSHMTRDEAARFICRIALSIATEGV